jgi:hypothetical protein
MSSIKTKIQNITCCYSVPASNAVPKVSDFIILVTVNTVIAWGWGETLSGFLGGYEQENR